MDFMQAKLAYNHLKGQFEQGQISAEEFERRVNESVVTDENGAEWQIGVSSGKWYRYDGGQWQEEIPPEILSYKQPSAPVPVIHPTQAAPQYLEQPKGINWLTGFLIAAGLGLCCLVMGVGGWLVWNYNPSPAPLDVPTITLSAIPSNAPIIPSVTKVVPSTASPEPIAGSGFDPGLVQFKDDFSNPNSGWDDIRVRDDFNTYYFEDAYVFAILKPATSAEANPHKNFPDDVQVEVDARKISGSQNDEYGLLCRFAENGDGTGSYYYFAITTYGAGLIYKVEHDQAILINSPQPSMTGIVLPGDQVNRIRGDCIGNKLTLYVNGQFLNSAVDSAFGSGGVGLRAGSETGQTEIRFDNFIVYKPEN